MSKINKLPKDIEIHLDNNILFNKFGLVNISAVRGRTGTTLDSNELKEMIQERFGKEFADGKIEFIDEKK